MIDEIGQFNHLLSAQCSYFQLQKLLTNKDIL